MVLLKVTLWKEMSRPHLIVASGNMENNSVDSSSRRGKGVGIFSFNSQYCTYHVRYNFLFFLFLFLPAVFPVFKVPYQNLVQKCFYDDEGQGRESKVT